MKPILGIALVALMNVPEFAASEATGQCSGLYYPFLVKDVLIEFSDQEVIPRDFDLEYRIAGDLGTTIPLRADIGKKQWTGTTSFGFKRAEIDVWPRLPGLSVSGPEACEFKLNGNRCALLFRFRADRVKIAFRASPPGTTLRIKPAAQRPSQFNPSCRPSNAAWRLTGTGSGDDLALANRIRDALAAAPELGSYALEVEIRQKAVVLTGVVRDERAKRRAKAIANLEAQRMGFTVVENLKLSQLDDGTSLVEIDSSTVEIEGIAGTRSLFRSQLKVRWDLLQDDKPWSVTREDLQRGLIRSGGEVQGTAATVRQQGQQKHDRAAKQYIDAKLGDLVEVTIERSRW